MTVTTSYIYKSVFYSSESDAQDAVNALKVRLDSNPTDWMEAKEITGSSQSGWTVMPTKLTDAELLSPDSSKTYSCYSQYDGQTYMPLTSSELVTKRGELRTKYADHFDVSRIHKLVIDDSTDPDTITETIITPTTDMSGYVS